VWWFLTTFLFCVCLLPVAQETVCLCQHERSPSVSRQRQETRLFIPGRCFSQWSPRCEQSAQCFVSIAPLAAIADC
jgi:hypothetical protein